TAFAGEQPKQGGYDMAKSTSKTKKRGKAKSALRLGKMMPGRTIMDVPRMEVVDYVGWGKLIKGWSKNPSTAPTDLQDLISQCAHAGVGLTVPSYVTKLQVIVQDEDTFVLRLPPWPKIKESEDKLKAGGLYPIPHFYNDRYGVILDIPQDGK